MFVLSRDKTSRLSKKPARGFILLSSIVAWFVCSLVQGKEFKTHSREQILEGEFPRCLCRKMPLENGDALRKRVSSFESNALAFEGNETQRNSMIIYHCWFINGRRLVFEIFIYASFSNLSYFSLFRSLFQGINQSNCVCARLITGANCVRLFCFAIVILGVYFLFPFCILFFLLARINFLSLLWVFEKKIRILRYILLAHSRNPETHFFQVAPYIRTVVSLPFLSTFRFRVPRFIKLVRLSSYATYRSRVEIPCKIHENAKHENLLEIAQFCVCPLLHQLYCLIFFFIIILETITSCHST